VGVLRLEAVQGQGAEGAAAQRDGHRVVAPGRGDVEVGVAAIADPLEHPVVVGDPGRRVDGQVGRVVAGHGQAELGGAGFDPTAVGGHDDGPGPLVGAVRAVVEALVAAEAPRPVDPLGEVGGVGVEIGVEGV
jgi:hypothetical protein